MEITREQALCLAQIIEILYRETELKLEYSQISPEWEAGRLLMAMREKVIMDMDRRIVVHSSMPK